MIDRRILAVLVVFAASVLARAQGMIPPPAASTPTLTDPGKPLLIGERVPPTVRALDENGQWRSLLSYKSAIEVLVVVYLSPTCQQNDSVWLKLKRLEEDYAGWHTAFVAMMPSDTPSTYAGLLTTLRDKTITWPLLQDSDRVSSAQFAVSATPEMIIIDEFGHLRYRGPIDHVRKTLDTLISQSGAIKNPEPPMDGLCPL